MSSTIPKCKPNSFDLPLWRATDDIFLKVWHEPRKATVSILWDHMVCCSLHVPIVDLLMDPSWHGSKVCKVIFSDMCPCIVPRSTITNFNHNKQVCQITLNRPKATMEDPLDFFKNQGRGWGNPSLGCKEIGLGLFPSCSAPLELQFDYNRARIKLLTDQSFGSCL